MNESKIDLYRGLTTREAQRRIKKIWTQCFKEEEKSISFQNIFRTV